MIAKVPLGGVGSGWRYASIEVQPRAIILDPNCRAPLTKLLNRVSQKKAQSPWIFCREDAQRSGECYVPIKSNNDGKFEWEDILSTLSTNGTGLVLIEGGGVVINDILKQRIADIIIISISPVFLGRDGVGICPVLHEPEWLEDVQGMMVGSDYVIVA